MAAELTPDPERSDAQLMAAVRAGDADALGALFSRHHGDVYALSARLTQDRDLADDITQEAFLRVWRYARSFRGQSTFRTWLYRLTYNLFIDLRQRDVRQASLALERPPAEEPPHEVTERHMLLETALRRLAPDQRAVLILSRFHGLRYEEIARIIRCSPGAARVRLHRAMNDLRRLCFALEAEGAAHDV